MSGAWAERLRLLDGYSPKTTGKKKKKKKKKKVADP